MAVHRRIGRIEPARMPCIRQCVGGEPTGHRLPRRTRHNYNPEQKAFDDGKTDAFVQSVSVDTCTGLYGAPGLSMDYDDGNTVTGLSNYAQQYALSDNPYDSTFGPSTPGALTSSPPGRTASGRSPR